jgi:DNA-binding response OmpR family regulator
VGQIEDDNLVVDDDEIVARTIERSLRAGGFRVAVVHSGVEALRSARRQPPDLMVLDIIMPGLDGFEVCRQVRADPILKDLPILFLTAKAKEEDRIVGLYTLDTRSFEIEGPNGISILTPVQFDLLYHLMSHPGQVFSPERLLQEVWDYPHDTGSPDLVRVHIKNLRVKTESDPSNPLFIQTIKGHGYKVIEK